MKTPGFLTSITYQALHTKYRELISDQSTDDVLAAEEEASIRTKAIDSEEISSLIALLEKAGIQTLILDEAHHLRAEWWKALRKVVESIKGMVVVSLTATPPYDSKTSEWKRYEELCGVIDEEISVPELVKAGTLCPHQDFVWTVVPTEYERTYLDEYQRHVTEVVAGLYEDQFLKEAVQEHTWMTPSEEINDQIFGEPQFAISLLVYLKGKNLPLPEQLLALLDMQPKDVPELNDYWWQQLVNAYLYKATGWTAHQRFSDHRKTLARSLRDRKLLRNRELQLSDAKLVKRHMTQSSAKIQACVDIYTHERKLRGDQLRQVVLTDFIRDEGLNTHTDHQVDMLGAWPIFRALANQLPDEERKTCALLTGRLVVVHETVAAAIDNTMPHKHLSHLDGFVVVENFSSNPVTVLTHLLASGQIHVLVGTRALLGEGWDAPCINSLILASSVGSYMLTNQMRGRAIRVDKRQPDKCASIWHIVAIVLDRKAISFDLGRSVLFAPGLADFRELDNRFATFVGVHAKESRIENNLLRLELPYAKRQCDYVSGAEYLTLQTKYFRTGAKLESTNKSMVTRLHMLDALRERWGVALETATAGKVVPSVASSEPPTERPFHFRKTLRQLLIVAIIAFLTAAYFTQLITSHIGIIFVIALIWSLPKFLRAGWLFLKHLPVDGTIHQIGLAVRDTLCATQIIDNTASRLRVQSTSLGGDVYVNLRGGTFHEKSIFAECMEEILGSIDNPRYLIVRHGKQLGFRKKDYHAVPTRIGVKKQYATVLHQAWLKYVGNADLIYTRTAEARKLLLSARIRAFSGSTKKIIKRVDRWV